MEQNNTNNLPAAYAAPAPAPAPAPASYFTDMTRFEWAQRVAKMLAASTLIPPQFQGNIANTMIAMEMANRTGFDPFMVMQNLYVVHQRPAFSAQFVIAAINSCGRFSPLRFDLSGEGDEMECVAWVIEKATGERLEGSPVSIRMAKEEGWFSRNGSKWKTMPKQMLRYRAATFFGRLYAPDILMGMKTDDEIDDIGPAAPAAHIAPERMNGEATSPAQAERPVGAAAINALLDREQAAGEAATRPEQIVDVVAAPDPPPDPPEVPKPEQQTLLQSEPEELAEYRAAAQKHIAEIDALDDLTALKSWWSSRRDYNKTIRELGGMNSEWHQSVVEHLNARINAVEAEARRK